MKKILLIQTAFIGDVVLATSLAETIRAESTRSASPEFQIDFFVRKGNEDLLANNPLVNQVLVWDKKKKIRSLLKNILAIRRTQYDAVVNVQRFFNSGLVTAFSKGRQKIGFAQNPLSFIFDHKVNHRIPHEVNGEFWHEIQRNAGLLTPLFPELNPKQAARPKLYFNQSVEDKIDGIIRDKKPYIVLAPTSVWFTKQWSASKWSELAKLLNKDFHLFFIGAPADREAIENIIANQPNCSNLAGELSLLESACLMKEARRVFVNDSAPLHLASSANAKTTAIFCSTVPDFGYYPLSEDAVVVARKPRLDCQPCGLHGRKECPLGHFKCSLEIPAIEAASTAFENKRPSEQEGPKLSGH